LVKPVAQWVGITGNLLADEGEAWEIALWYNLKPVTRKLPVQIAPCSEVTP